jgi:hypothetical protein
MHVGVEQFDTAVGELRPADKQLWLPPEPACQQWNVGAAASCSDNWARCIDEKVEAYRREVQRCEQMTTQNPTGGGLCLRDARRNRDRDIAYCQEQVCPAGENCHLSGSSWSVSICCRISVEACSGPVCCSAGQACCEGQCIARVPCGRCSSECRPTQICCNGVCNGNCTDCSDPNCCPGRRGCYDDQDRFLGCCSAAGGRVCCQGFCIPPESPCPP